MLTPDFRIAQDDEAVTFYLRMPYIRAQDVEIRVDGREFLVCVKPYYLRVELSGRMVEDDRIMAKYDIASGEMKLKVYKEEKGETFVDLDLLNKLYVRKKGRDIRTGRDLVQELELDGCDISLRGNEEQVALQFSDEEVKNEDSGKHFYGFNSQYENLGSRIEETSYEIVRISNIDNLCAQDRHKLRIESEDRKFDGEHYAADFKDYEIINQFLKFHPRTHYALAEFQALKRTKPGALLGDIEWLKFSEKEKSRLIQLSNRNYIIDNEKAVYLGMLDIILAYCYDHRTTMGETTSESAWTIATLSSLLSSLDSFNSLSDVLKAFIRRSISFPLYRNYELSKKCVKDAVVILKLGKMCALRCMLEVKHILENDERTQILSCIYLHDYCVWIQKCSEVNMQKLASSLNNFELHKSMTAWNLDDLEEDDHN